uniref:Mitochondrial uncoupling protein 5 n=1 Tax=Quercus lobata TaxID=97700 RepID=A0A7N2MWH4_QUELO
MGLKGFVEGGIASIIAGASTHPLDLIKVRMQLQGESNPALVQPYRPTVAALNTPNGYVSLHIAPPPRVGLVSIGTQIVKSEGATALFSDTAAKLPIMKKIVAGLVAGSVGAAVGNPADVAMVRMQADGRLPIEQRRSYKSVVDAIGQMSKQEGIASLWRGSALTVNRAMIVTASQLSTYDQVKEMILEKGVMSDGIGTHVTASFAAGFVASVASNPIDVIKTRVMNMKLEAGGVAPYSGALDCAMKTVRTEGVMALYKGFIPTISRQGPFTVVLFVTLEQVRKLFKDL